MLKIGDAWWFMFFYSVTFGGFVGLASSLTIYFNAEYGLQPVTAGYFTAACVFAGSLVRPIGGALADRVGGVRALSVLYVVAAVVLDRSSASVCRRPGWRWSCSSSPCCRSAWATARCSSWCRSGSGSEIGVMTGLVGMTGGIGGFYLASSLGYSKQITGSYQSGLLVFAIWR